MNSPELQIADNDYAVGSVIQAVAQSPYKDSTLVLVIEDDAQNGGDHVDAHRSTAFVVAPCVKHNFVDSTRYKTVNVLATMERILGIAPPNLNDTNAEPMANAFNIGQKNWTYTAIPSACLENTTLPIPKAVFTLSTAALFPLHDAAWWTVRTRGMDFSGEDHLDSAKFNWVVWRSVVGDKPYPIARSGADLSVERAALLAKHRLAQKPEQSAAHAEPGPGNRVQRSRLQKPLR